METSWRDFDRQPLVHAAAHAGILAFRVLADDDPVQVLGLDIAQRALNAGQDAGRADIGVLVERLADREPQAPERDVVGNVGGADRAEIDGVERLQLLPAVGGHHDAVLLVVIRSPVEGFEFE